MFNLLSSLFRSRPQTELMGYSVLEERCLDGLDDALRLIPPAEKVDLVRALNEVPLLVATESAPLKFLRRESFNFRAAARRLCSYWFYRRKFFGDRAFLPMTITGSGAMSEEDISAFSLGHFVLVGEENSLAPSFFVDRGAVLLNMSPLTQSRCTFYCSLCYVKMSVRLLTEL